MISANLTYLRKYYKYSQEYLAEKIGVSRQAVAKWESGETVPDLETVSLLPVYTTLLWIIWFITIQKERICQSHLKANTLLARSQ